MASKLLSLSASSLFITTLPKRTKAMKLNHTNNNVILLLLLSFFSGFVSCAIILLSFRGLLYNNSNNIDHVLQQQQQRHDSIVGNNANKNWTLPKLIRNRQNVPFRSTSHNGGTNNNGPIYKQQFIEPFQIHTNIAGISIATIQPGQTIEQHHHESMHEFFYILTGTVTIIYGDNNNDYNNNIINYSSSIVVDNETNRQADAQRQQEQYRQVCSAGYFFHAPPGVNHSFIVDHDAMDNCTMMVIGITTTTTT